jgi:UDP-N-acetylmuramate dehydrogenase
MGKMKPLFFDSLKEAGIEFYPSYAVKKRTTFNIGGIVDCYVRVKDLTELAVAVRAAKAAKKEIFVMGNLSNVLISDRRINKVFIGLEGSFLEISRKGAASLYAGAGVKVSGLTAFLIKNGLTGLEFMAGIPGTVGGAVYMNAGAYGKGIGAFITKVHFMDKKGKCGVIVNPEKAFTYRHSIFQKNGFIITGAEFKLKKGDSVKIRKETSELIKTRHKKHPWDAYCAGSFFKNPAECPAGSLIERAGLKGKKAGGAMVSKMHANFLINITGKASFGDVVKLAGLVKKEVKKKFGVTLTEEVRYIK